MRANAYAQIHTLGGKRQHFAQRVAFQLAANRKMRGKRGILNIRQLAQRIEAALVAKRQQSRRAPLACLGVL